ncbi:MAG: META domain-containing protein [Silicimonas sp.]|nr:META domain-containing protein [Silicimonas sp.]
MAAATTVFGVLAACSDETISGYADPDATYVLSELGGAAFPARATIAFPAKGKVTGSAPCNTFNATQSVPYPWVDIGPVAATRRACPDLDAERRFFEALETMVFAEVQGPVLILSSEDGVEMVFRAAD